MRTRCNGDRYLKEFSCWKRYLTLAFAQFVYREGLRDVESGLYSMCGKLYHLGIRGSVARSTLADATGNWDWRFFADFAQALIAIARPSHATDPMAIDSGQSLYALDATTTFDLYLSLFPLGTTLDAARSARQHCGIFLYFRWNTARSSRARSSLLGGHPKPANEGQLKTGQ